MIVLVDTVKGLAEGYTRSEILQAKEARKALAMMGYPSKQAMQDMVRNGWIRNFSVLPDKITNVKNVFGRNVSTLKGKSVQRVLDPVRGE